MWLLSDYWLYKSTQVFTVLQVNERTQTNDIIYLQTRIVTFYAECDKIKISLFVFKISSVSANTSSPSEHWWCLISNLKSRFWEKEEKVCCHTAYAWSYSSSTKVGIQNFFVASTDCSKNASDGTWCLNIDVLLYTSSHTPRCGGKYQLVSCLYYLF